MPPPQEVIELVERFRRNLALYKRDDYKETRLRVEFVDPFFEALGWDVRNVQGYAEQYKDVVHEDALRRTEEQCCLSRRGTAYLNLRRQVSRFRCCDFSRQSLLANEFAATDFGSANLSRRRQDREEDLTPARAKAAPL